MEVKFPAAAGIEPLIPQRDIETCWALGKSQNKFLAPKEELKELSSRDTLSSDVRLECNGGAIVF
jgi:hypothetical protein